MKTAGRRQWCHSGVFIVKCEHVLHFVLIANLNSQAFVELILKMQTLMKAKSGISCVMLYYLQCKQNLLTNSM